ncbi:polyprenyl synthetase family protein [Mycobacterium intracellulare]|uniref:Polyprenyl synthetase n=1 Tax=Mycobacterium intracellulare subsp. chimaera TaxID=222805 RepID=A0A220YG99_MYCIT|nr:polyprenyl synthetase family protein [Mycobacterium intracellulare]ASL10763.1 polyprenyl synthetase [Mycobacterium intracellulare subsp. chimaera]ASL16653.1 polyprenyl synthetase [Mycobacterium intracellulare subsp. chimaera]ASL22705.1 polyprenyl synthetase [Mycobacterium intracellulare subsp. chimaera]MCF1811335.1 polyprenyl synthetase family protein [Mycobacterium intracellulare subsp. intracellulare]MCV7326025.1 polyprenyl synthetase family protein [Mycobacterium intracellulare subsp. ch
MGALSFSPAGASPPVTGSWDGDDFGEWRSEVRRRVLVEVAEFVAQRRAADLDGAGIEAVGDILADFVSGGKCLRSTFVYLGWLCGAPADPAALRAAASFELVHAFALLQDDVMDGSAVRRGRPSAHRQFGRWHRERGLPGPSWRFGESAAILLGDLCLIWAEQMLRDSGIDPRRLQLAWPRYDAMRTELAVGQFADLINDARQAPGLEFVLDVARRKSGNYTVRRPLEIGAAMAGCGAHTLCQLGRYGRAVGEAFQLRDDVLGVFGSPAVTGKPGAIDLFERKATSVVVAAHQLADPSTRRELTELANREALGRDAIDRWKALIIGTGAVGLIEEMIGDRVASARAHLGDLPIEEPVRIALAEMAAACTDRAV